MKILKFLFSILIILFKTGNVLSDNNIFNVNNIDLNKENSENKEILFNKAFYKAFDKLTNRLLLEEDYLRLSNTSLKQVKNLISYYQITNQDKKKIKVSDKQINVFFDKDSMHNFFYTRNILYSDIINTEAIIFPLLIIKEEHFIYTQNYFYNNWNNEILDDLIQYILPAENIEVIDKINLNKNNIYKLEISDFFEEYENQNIVFANIEINKDKADIFLKTRIEGKKINKKLFIDKEKNIKKNDFYKRIILKIDKEIKDLVKSQNLIDVRTPSFLNARIELKEINNLFLFNERVKKIDLIDNFYIQQINKDYAFVKIKYLGKISKIINKLKKENINLNVVAGQWQLSII